MVAVYIMTVLMFFFLSHYRMPVTPFLMIFAAYYCVWMFDEVRKRRWLNSSLAILVLMGSALWVHLNLTNPNFEMQNIHFNLGNVYVKQERYDEAIREFRASIDLNPNVISRYHNLAYVYGLRPETYKEAIKTWETVLAIGMERNDDYHVRAAKQEISRLRDALADAE
jgi:tetratricopeptide (TPR) repeat protein